MPVPQVDSLESLNAQLRERCLADLTERTRGKPAPKGELLLEDQAAFLPLPKQPFEARRVDDGTANSESLVRFDTNDYSVPVRYAHRKLIVVATVEEVRLVYEDRLVARHRRCWERERTFFEPIHYLALLERKPGGFDYARPLENWQLPECFPLLRRRLEAADERSGTRSYIRVLRLLEKFSLPQLTGAVEYALDIDVIDPDSIRTIVEHRAERPVELFSLDGRPWLQAVRVETTDVSSYQALLGGGVAMNKTETKSTVLLKHHLKALKLPTMHAECEKIAARAAQDNADHLAFLLQLCELELIERERKAAERRLKAARFPAHKLLDEFDFAARPSVNKPLMLELVKGEYLDKRENILLVGPSGTGKSHLATALGMAACAQGRKVRFFRVTELITLLLEAKEERQLLRLRQQLGKLDLLILDELGYVPASKAGAELLFDVIATAYERNSLIVTTNLPFENWTEVLGSERLTGAALDRLTHRCHILETKGESYRLQDAKRRRRRTD